MRRRPPLRDDRHVTERPVVVGDDVHLAVRRAAVDAAAGADRDVDELVRLEPDGGPPLAVLRDEQSAAAGEHDQPPSASVSTPASPEASVGGRTNSPGSSEQSTLARRNTAPSSVVRYTVSSLASPVTETARQSASTSSIPEKSRLTAPATSYVPTAPLSPTR